jgi:molecular chaperone IbpB
MAAPGLVSQAFSLSFTLADNMEVSGATFTNGLLHIDLTRNEPEQIARSVSPSANDRR